MKEKEVSDIKKSHPLMNHVLRQIDNGKKILPISPFFATYLLARTRGFVERTGDDKKTIEVSSRGKEFMNS